MADVLSRTRRNILQGPQACARTRSQVPGLRGWADSGNERSGQGGVRGPLGEPGPAWRGRCARGPPVKITGTRHLGKPDLLIGV